MIPLRQTSTEVGRPWMNQILLATTFAAFLLQVLLVRHLDLIIQLFGFIPSRLFSASLLPERLHGAMTLLTSLFLHGGVVHLVGNLLYLYVFGGAVEKDLGHLRYAVFYLVSGALGSVLHGALFPLSSTPSIGASGAIAGVLGAFFVLHTRARIASTDPVRRRLDPGGAPRSSFPSPLVCPSTDERLGIAVSNRERSDGWGGVVGTRRRFCLRDGRGSGDPISRYGRRFRWDGRAAGLTRVKMSRIRDRGPCAFSF